VAIRILDDLFPVVITVSSGGESTDDMKSFVRGMDAVYDRGERCVFLAVIGSSDRGLSGELEPVGRWMRENRDRLERLTAATVFYAPESPLFRFVLSALFLFQRLPYPYEVTSDLSSGLDWLEQRCRTEAFHFDRGRVVTFLGQRNIVAPAALLDRSA
jgi:hypothetical protein